MKKLFFGLTGIFLLLSLCGCAAILIGGSVAGGIAISKDTATLEKDASFTKAWDVAYDTIDSMGIINFKNKKDGVIEADVGGSKVIARLKQITGRTVRIRIKARKNLFPNIDLAVEVINKINDKL